jgi:hypothetical protein
MLYAYSIRAPYFLRQRRKSTHGRTHCVRAVHGGELNLSRTIGSQRVGASGPSPAGTQLPPGPHELIYCLSRCERQQRATRILPICGYRFVGSMTPQWSIVAGTEW